jgi:GT2 family glycosyltransferase
MIAEQYHDEKERLKAMALIENSEYDVTLSIVSHNSRRDLQGLMPSVSKACGDVSHEIIVVDNRSTDGSARYISEKHSHVKLLKNKARKGYGANHNQSIAIARGRYTALMNADLVLTPCSIARLVEYMDMNPDTGMVSGNFVFPDGTPQYLNK